MLSPIVSREDVETILKQKFDKKKQEWVTKEDSEIFKNHLSIQKVLKRGVVSFSTGIMGPNWGRYVTVIYNNVKGDWRSELLFSTHLS